MFLLGSVAVESLRSQLKRKRPWACSPFYLRSPTYASSPGLEAVVVTCLLTYPPSLCFRLSSTATAIPSWGPCPCLCPFPADSVSSVRVWFWASQGTRGIGLSWHICCLGARSWLHGPLNKGIISLTPGTCEVGIPFQGPFLHSLRALDCCGLWELNPKEELGSLAVTMVCQQQAHGLHRVKSQIL